MFFSSGVYQVQQTYLRGLSFCRAFDAKRCEGGFMRHKTGRPRRAFARRGRFRFVCRNSGKTKGAARRKVWRRPVMGITPWNPWEPELPHRPASHNLNQYAKQMRSLFATVEAMSCPHAFLLASGVPRLVYTFISNVYWYNCCFPGRIFCKSRSSLALFLHNCAECAFMCSAKEAAGRRQPPPV